MKKNLILFIALFSFADAFCQKESNHWCFGQYNTINFDNCTPIASTETSLYSIEGASCISDKTTGELLFYTNGVTVWDRNDSPMPNGSGLSGNQSNTQVLITPMPGSSNKFYIFTTDLQGNSGPGLRYSIVDMTLNSGFGDVLTKNYLLHNPIVCEKLTATWHSNGTDIWVVAHEFGNNNFLSFQISSVGVSATPIISSIGFNHIGGYDSRGELKFSPNGNKLSNATNGDGSGICANELFDFNTTTGVVSNCISLPNENWGYGTCFSLDNSKLYFTTSPVFATSTTYSKLYQFDLSSGVPSTIIASKCIIDSVNVFTENSYQSCYLGLDGKIYVALYGANYIGMINSPDVAGTSCNFVKNGLYLNGQQCLSGTNNLISVTDTCSLTSVDDNFLSQNELLVYPNPFTTTVTINFSNFRFLPKSVFLYDLCGNKIMDFEITQPILQINRGNMKKGIYILQVPSGDRNNINYKIVIE